MALWYPIDGGIEAIVPSDAVSFIVEAWILPQLVTPADQRWSISSISDPWIVLRPGVSIRPPHVWVWKDSGRQTHVTYENGSPDTDIYIGRDGQPPEVRRDLWYPVPAGSEFLVPEDAVSFLVADPTLPIITVSPMGEYRNLETEQHWVIRKFLRVRVDDEGRTLCAMSVSRIDPRCTSVGAGNRWRKPQRFGKALRMASRL